jgi:hypothetical protein
LKPAALAAAGLSIALGMVIVLVFREPVRKESDPLGSNPRSYADDEVWTPSRRVVVVGAKSTASAATVAEAPARGVDPLWADKNRSAIQLLEKGHHEQAVALFEACVQAVPHEKVFRQNLAEGLARWSTEEWDRGGTAGQSSAVAHMKRAAELAPDREDIQKRLEQMLKLARSESGNWTESSGHFDLSYDGSRDDLAFRTTEVFDILEGAYLDFTEQFGIDPVADGRARIRVVFYKREGFHGATGIGHWAGGLYDGSIRVPLEDLGQERNQLRRVLRHELVHAFAHESGGRDVPGWLNEGLAQLLEDGDPATLGRSLDAARRRLAGGTLATLQALSGSLSTTGDDAAIQRAYAQALLFLDFIAREYGDRVPFAMVAGCKQDGGPAAAFQRAVGIALPVAFEDFRAAISR